MPFFTTGLSSRLKASAYCFAIACCLLPSALAAGAEKDAALMKSATEAGKISAPEKKLFEESIRGTKQSIARETLDVFYRDALDYYHARRYDEAMELLDKIISVDPTYEDVQTLRRSILKAKSNRQQRNVQKEVADVMRQGNKAYDAGQPILAISQWQKALDIAPDYAPAKKRIQEVNHQLAQKQFETGYLHYHHGNLEDAMEAWHNAIALDPSYKQRGLLLLMSKVERSVRKSQAARLVGQAYEQYSNRLYEASLQSYQELLRLEPRHDEARRMSAKIRIQLGQAAFKAAREAQAKRQFEAANQQYAKAIHHGYEVRKSQDAMKANEAALKKLKTVKRRPTPQPVTATAAPAASAPAAAPPVPMAPPTPIDEEGALTHYRQGLSAFKGKDYPRAVSELKIAAQLDPSNEHIYIALQRAQQEWNAAKSMPAGGATAQ